MGDSILKRIFCLILTFVLSMSLCTAFAEETVEESQIDAKEVGVEVDETTTVTDEHGESIEEEAELLASESLNLWVGDVYWLDIYDYTMGVDVQTSSISWYSNAPSEVKILSKSWDMRECQIKAVSSTGSTPAIVTCQYREATFSGNYHYQTVDFYVYVKQSVSVSKMSFEEESLVLKVGSSKSFNVSISPVNATNKKIIWSSSNPDVATCSSIIPGGSYYYGFVETKAVGEAIITGTTSSGGYTDTIKVRVYSVGEKGDVNGDGIYNVADGLMAIRMGLPSSHANYLDAVNEEKTAADVNGDGVYNVADALLMIRRGLPSSHPNSISKFPIE